MQDLSLNTEIWIAGKGPSFDRYSWYKAGQTIGINETAVLIPNCWGAAATEYNILKFYTKSIPKSTCVISMRSNPMVYFHKHIIWEPSDVRKLQGGTVNLLVEILAKRGVKKIHFVGFDSMDKNYGFSKKIIKMDAFTMQPANYDFINQCLLETLEYTGIEPVWENRNV